jgi:hypothetical protein
VEEGKGDAQEFINVPVMFTFDLDTVNFLTAQWCE